MRSINTKRIAAIAAGAAMVGSVLATGLASTPDEISGYVTQLKQNLNDVSIVVGSEAALSDGISAAKIAAKLTALNYKEMTEVPDCQVDVSALTCTGGQTTEAKVKLSSTTAGASESISSNEWNVVLRGTNPTKTSYGTEYKNITVEPPGILPDVLSQRTLSVTEGGTSKQYTYKEMVKLGYGTYSGDTTGLQAKYLEDWSTGQYGLYLKARYGDIIYRLDFGQGFPLNASYDSYPEIVVLGKTYAIGTQSGQYGPGKITLLSGNRYYMQAGEDQTIGDYTVTLNSVGMTSNNKVAATITVTGPTGSDTRQLTVGGSYDFFDGAVSVLVESAAQAAYTGTNQATGTATLRIGTGSLKLVDNTQFPLDPKWTVAKVNITEDSDYKKLHYVDIKYGDASDIGSYDFDATTPQTGLKEKVVIPGPKNADGESVFNIQLAGLEAVDSTQVTFEGVGSGSTDMIKVKYIDRSGNENYYDKYPLLTSGIGNFTVDTTTVDLMPGYQTFVNDKVVAFKALGDQSSDLLSQDVILDIAGVEQTYTLTRDNTSVSIYNISEAKYNTLAYPINCKLQYNSSNGKLTIQDTKKVDIGPNNMDDEACDLFPNYVPVGNKLVMDKTNNPYMDLRGILGTEKVFYNATGSSNLTLPFALVNETGGKSTIGIVYDSETGSESPADTYTGFEVYQNASIVSGALNVTNTSSYVRQDLSTNKDEYHITPLGTIIDGTTQNKLALTLAEEGRDTILQITGQPITGNETKQIQELGVGDEAWGVHVEDISCTASGATIANPEDATCTLGSLGTVYEQRAAMIPENLVITDKDTPATYQIVVGGPVVNKLAQGVPGIENLKEAGDKAIIVDGTKIVIAGYLAKNTEDAVDEFLTYLV